MSKKKDDGGPVYPGQWIDSLPTTGEQVVRDQWEGMSLRDYFAAKAMHGILANEGVKVTDDYEKVVADWAYHFADAMLKERKK
jgi:hypothetical protein